MFPLPAKEYRALFLLGWEYSYIRILPDIFHLKSVVKFISKEISWAEHEYMSIQLPPPPPPQLRL